MTVSGLSFRLDFSTTGDGEPWRRVEMLYLSMLSSPAVGQGFLWLNSKLGENAQA